MASRFEINFVDPSPGQGEKIRHYVAHRLRYARHAQRFTIVTVRHPPGAASTKYDAHHKVLNTTYGSFADLRRELADSKEKVAEREARC